jgi:hypothetical protein
VIEQLQEYASAGAEELMIQWISLDDLEAIAVIAEQGLPHFTASADGATVVEGIKLAPSGPLPIQNWANILNQLAGAHRARFAGRFLL